MDEVRTDPIVYLLVADLIAFLMFCIVISGWAVAQLIF